MPTLHPLHLVFFFGFVTLTSAGLYDFRNLELARYDEEVKIVHEQLIEEGWQDVHTEKRALRAFEISQVKLEMKKKLYEKMIDMLVECRMTKLEKNKPLSTTITAPKTTPEKPAKTSTSPSSLSTTPATTSNTTTASTTPTTPTTKTMPSTTPTTPSTTATSTPTTTPTTKTTPSTSPATTSTTTTTTTTTQPPTTLIPQPTECQSAINLTESWRMDHIRSLIKPKNGRINCDTKDMVKSGRPWFRFSGAAGNRLLNKCAPSSSCGTYVVLWSDDATPTRIGVISQITAYGNSDGSHQTIDYSCRFYKKKISIMRCSHKPHDFVYRYDDTAGFDDGFCGMLA